MVGKHGKLDGAVNLAAVVGKQLGIANVENIDDEEWDLVLGVNLGGMLNCLRAQIPVMKAGNGSEIGGSIVNAASVAGVIGIVSFDSSCGQGSADEDSQQTQRMLQVSMPLWG